MSVPNRQPLTLETGPWKGMLYTHNPTSPDRVLVAVNGWVDDGGSYRGRPGRYRITGTQLGSGGAGQLVYQFTKIDGTQYTVGIVGGKFYTLNWATGVWTEVVTGANFATATISLSSSARCYAVTLNDKMVVSDGVNLPWTWDGTSGAGGLTKLSNCPVLYGQPTVYYAKLFGIKNTERSTVVWSEENDPTTGYEAGGFNNAWTLSQTGSDPLYAIRATNEALFYWRQRSIGAIRGAVDDNFTNSGVLDAVSTLVGTRSPAGVCIYNNTAYFPDEYGRPCAFAIGGEVVELWRQVSLMFDQDTQSQNYLGLLLSMDLSAASIALMDTIPLRALGGMMFRTVSVNGDAGTSGCFYFGSNNVAQGVWVGGNGGLASAGGEVINSVTNLPEVMDITTVGYTFSTGKAAQWVDQNTSGVNIGADLSVILPRMAANPAVEIHFDRAYLIVGADSDSITWTMGCNTSRDQGSAATLAQNVSTSGAFIEKRIAYGLNRQGRWGQMRVTASYGSPSASGESLSLYGAALVGFPVSLTSGVP